MHNAALAHKDSETAGKLTPQWLTKPSVAPLVDGSRPMQSALTGPWEPAGTARNAHGEDASRRPHQDGMHGASRGAGPRMNGLDASNRGQRGWRDEERSLPPASRRVGPPGSRWSTTPHEDGPSERADHLPAGPPDRWGDSGPRGADKTIPGGRLHTPPHPAGQGGPYAAQQGDRWGSAADRWGHSAGRDRWMTGIFTEHLSGADEEHGVHALHDNRQGGAPGFGAPPLRAGMSAAGVGPPDTGPLPPSGGRGFGIGRGRGLKAASEQQSDRWGNLGGKEQQQELRDAAVSDPEMLATHAAPANVMQLLAEPLHTASGSLVEDAEQGLGPLRPGQSAEHTVDQTFSAAAAAPGASATEVQSQPMTLLGNLRAEASADSGPAVAAGHEQIYSYKDPAGAMQGNFSRVEILRWHEDGYFGLDLPLRCVKDGTDSLLRPLGDWMHDWEHGGLQSAPPPGFASVVAAPSGEPGAAAASAQTPAASQAAAPQRLQQDQARLVATSGNQHSTHGQLYDNHLFPEAIAARQRVAFPAKGNANGVLDHQQGDGHLHNAQYQTTMQAHASGLRSVDASHDVTGASGGSEQMQQQQALASRSGAALSSGYPQLPWPQHEQQLPPPHYPIQQPEQLLLQPHGLPPSLPQQRPALQTELSMGWTPPSLAAQVEGPAVPTLRPRLPAFAQLRAGGSSQDAEQEADVNELIELLRQPAAASLGAPLPALPDGLFAMQPEATTGPPEWFPSQHYQLSAVTEPLQHGPDPELNPPQAYLQPAAANVEEQHRSFAEHAKQQQHHAQQPAQMGRVSAAAGQMPAHSLHAGGMLAPFMPPPSATTTQHWPAAGSQPQYLSGWHEQPTPQQSEPVAHAWGDARPGNGKSLLDIQREEAVRAERDRAAGAAAEMANSSAGWAKASGHAWGSSAIDATRHASVRDILEEEQRQQATIQMQSNHYSNSSAASMAAGITQSSSTRDVVNPWGTAMHSAAEDQVVDFQPHRAVWEEVEEQRQGATGSKRQLAGTNGGQAHAGSAAADVSAAAVAHHSDDELFWDYGATPTTQLSAGSAPVNLQAAQPVHPQNAWQRKAAPEPWKGHTHVPQPQQLPPVTRAANGMAGQQAAQQLAGDTAKTSAPPLVLRTQEAEHDVGGGNLSAGFRDWCKGQMKLLNGSEDLTLVEFLMGLASSGETAEYIQLYLGNSAAGKPAVAAFTTEFLKRKLEELAPRKGKKKGQSSAPAQRISQPLPKPAVAQPSTPAASGWAKIPKTKGKQKQPKKSDGGSKQSSLVTGSGFAVLHERSDR